MCDRIVKLVEQQNDIFFNLLSLKHKLLLPARDCAKCHSKKNNWCVISTCHHEVCSDCLDFIKGTKCPVCNIQFDREKHVSTIEDMRIAYRSMEELIWKVQALDKRTLDSLYTDHKEALKDSDSSEDIFLSISGITAEEDLDLVKEFVSFFKIRHQSNWCDEITHLVMKHEPNGFVFRTVKYTNALLNNCVIVNIEWIKDSLGSERLKPAVNYMPKDESGEPAPFISWQVGKGVISSPLEWCKHCALHFHSHLPHFKFSSSLKIWAEKVGFVVLNEMSEFEDCQLKMRFILYDKSVKESKDPTIIPPNRREMTRWIRDYKAVTLDTGWFLECLFQYKFVKIDPMFHLMELNESLLIQTEMDVSNFILNRTK